VRFGRIPFYLASLHPPMLNLAVRGCRRILQWAEGVGEILRMGVHLNTQTIFPVEFDNSNMAVLEEDRRVLCSCLYGISCHTPHPRLRLYNDDEPSDFVPSVAVVYKHELTNLPFLVTVEKAR
jgi:hypothetical protein